MNGICPYCGKKSDDKSNHGYNFFPFHSQSCAATFGLKAYKAGYRVVQK
jgi:endogenous inhibitor of DNA gyrase (YacG/DUF329 family)